MSLNPEIPTLYMTVGLVASGKTTYAYRLAMDTNAVVVDSDEYRKDLFGDEKHQEDNKKLFEHLHRVVKQCLRAGKNVVFSATNLSSKRRRAFLNELTKIPCEKKCVIMATPFEQCVHNNYNRERQVPIDAMWRMYKSFQTPAMFEGWDSIEIKYWENSKQSVNAIKMLNSLLDFDQDNPHHTLSLGEHMRRTMAYTQSNWNDGDVPLDLYYASSLHDIGKTECRTYVDYKGRQCQYAHYYGHENVGAYDVLFFDFCSKQTDELTLAVSLLVNLHMTFYHFDKSPNAAKLHEKHKKLWGSELYNKVRHLHDSDVNAH